MDELLKVLQSKYPDVNFKVVKKDNKSIVLFDDEDLEWDEDFYIFFKETVESIIGESGLEEWIPNFDYLDVIKEGDNLNYYDTESISDILSVNLDVFKLHLNLNITKNTKKVENNRIANLIGDIFEKNQNVNKEIFVCNVSV